MYGHHAPALAMLHSSGGGPGLYVPGDEADNAAAASSSSSSNAAASTAEGAMIGNAAQGLVDAGGVGGGVRGGMGGIGIGEAAEGMAGTWAGRLAVTRSTQRLSGE